MHLVFWCKHARFEGVNLILGMAFCQSSLTAFVNVQYGAQTTKEITCPKSMVGLG